MTELAPDIKEFPYTDNSTDWVWYVAGVLGLPTYCLGMDTDSDEREYLVHHHIYQDRADRSIELSDTNALSIWIAKHKDTQDIPEEYMRFKMDIRTGMGATEKKKWYGSIEKIAIDEKNGSITFFDNQDEKVMTVFASGKTEPELTRES